MRLMVSRFQYMHIINVVLRRQRPFRQMVAIMIVLLVALVVQFQLTIAMAATAYALSGPVLRIIRRARGKAESIEGLTAPAAAQIMSELADNTDEVAEETADDEDAPH